MNIKVGDFVRIKPLEEAEYTKLWVYGMNKYAGKIIKVVELYDDGFYRKENGYWFDNNAVAEILNRKEEQ